MDLNTFAHCNAHHQQSIRKERQNFREIKTSLHNFMSYRHILCHQTGHRFCAAGILPTECRNIDVVCVIVEWINKTENLNDDDMRGGWCHALHREPMPKCNLTTRETCMKEISIDHLWSVYGVAAGNRFLCETRYRLIGVGSEQTLYPAKWARMSFIDVWFGALICVVVVGNTHPQVQISQMHCSLELLLNLLSSLLSLMVTLSWNLR